MLILDKPQQFNGKSIVVPLYHRGHLSMVPGAKVWLCFLPGIDSQRVLPEIVVAPIDVESWTDLWRIEIFLIDRIGVVNDVLEVLSNRKLNILAAESCAMDRQQLHLLEIIVDAKRYTGSVNGDGAHEDRSSMKIEELRDLRRGLLSGILPQVSFNRFGGPRIRIQRVQNLFDFVTAFRAAETLSGRKLCVPPDTGDAVVRESNGRVVIDLPQNIQERLRISTGGESSKYLRVSETRERFLRVYFLREVDRILACTIHHDEKVGAIAAITRALRLRNFNILTSLSRLYQHGARAQCELVLQCPADCPPDVAGRKQAVVDALGTTELLDDYKVNVGYPKMYGEVGTEVVTPVAGTGAETRGLDSRHTTVLEELGGIIKAFERRYSKLKTDDRSRLALARELLVEEQRAQGDPGSRTRTIFISCSFDDRTRPERLISSARKRKCVPVSGAKLGSGATIRGQVIRLMTQCTHFLGVWTVDTGPEAVGHNLPSPWLTWELGAAQASELKWHLMISKDIDPKWWKRIVGEKPHTVFGPSDFDKKLKDAFDGLLGDNEE